MNLSHTLKQVLICTFILLSYTASAQLKTEVRGTIKGARGELLAGATIIEKGTTNTAVTDKNGEFKMLVTPNAVLLVSYVNYIAKEIEIDDASQVQITLSSSTINMSEVVVTALDLSRQQRALGYNVGVVKSDEIVKAGTTNFATALYGKVPGLTIAATPGGATSGVSINIRGIYSIMERNQPLIILDGIPIKNEEYSQQTRLSGNGILDINPEDIESISVLKGAAAAALYGSDAVNNGAIVITTKTGKKSGKNVTIDFNARFGFDKIAYLPRFQKVRGPGFPSNLFSGGGGQNDSGFVYYDTNGDGTPDARGLIDVANSYPGYVINFGPVFDGKPTLGWDGKMHPYVASNNTYSGLFEPAPLNSSINVAASINSEKSNIRFSLTRQDNQALSIGASNSKNIANINGTFKLAKSFSTTFLINYINEDTKNRPYNVGRLLDNSPGMMDPFEDPSWYFNRYQTSKGYYFVTGKGTQSLTPAENIIYPNFKSPIANYLWQVNKNNLDENTNRIITGLTNNWDITKGFSLRTKIATDFRFIHSEEKDNSTIPIYFGYSGYYGVTNELYQITYGDILLTYRKKLSKNTELNILGGYTASKDTYNKVISNTNGGLSNENFFDIAASVNTSGGSSTNTTLVKDAFIGSANIAYKNYLFAEASVRRDRTSTLNPNNNAFLYPAANAAFVFSEVVKLPSFINYGKLRTSYGIIGSYPDPYQANIAYRQGTLGVQSAGSLPTIYTVLPSTFGNDGIRPEKRKEYEIGLETKLFNNRVSLDINYYDGTISDQILPLSIGSSFGATSVLSNVGKLRNRGIELAVTATLIKTKNLRWDMTINYAHNKNTVEELANGSKQIIHTDWDGSGARLVSTVGRPLGDILVHPVATNSNGQPIVDPNGLYKIDANNSDMVVAGNINPVATGGIVETFGYKNFTLEATFDYRIGGYILPAELSFLTNSGLTPLSTNYMDAAHGGLSYYTNTSGQNVQIPVTQSQGPNGEKVFHDGMLLKGVTANGSPNTNVVSQASYYYNVYNWGGPQYNANGRYDLMVQENSYIKLRELTIAYSLPPKLASKLKASNITLSLYARNLFFIYRTIKDMDGEQSAQGSRWYNNVYGMSTNPATRSFGIMLRSSF